MQTVKQEITLGLYGLNIGVQAVQWSAVHMPTWAHVLVTVGASTLAAIVNRASVTPNAKIGA